MPVSLVEDVEHPRTLESRGNWIGDKPLQIVFRALKSPQTLRNAKVQAKLVDCILGGAQFSVESIGESLHRETAFFGDIPKEQDVRVRTARLHAAPLRTCAAGPL
jgi:hypothetical protein